MSRAHETDGGGQRGLALKAVCEALVTNTGTDKEVPEDSNGIHKHLCVCV